MPDQRALDMPFRLNYPVCGDLASVTCCETIGLVDHAHGRELIPDQFVMPAPAADMGGEAIQLPGHGLVPFAVSGGDPQVVVPDAFAVRLPDALAGFQDKALRLLSAYRFSDRAVQPAMSQG